MRSLVSLAGGLAMLVAAPSCSGSPAAPSVLSLGGNWDGPGSNQLGGHMISLAVAQNGSALSGTVATRAVDPLGTTCSSCHMNKAGTFTGAISGSTLTLNMVFPAGNPADPTPICSATMIVSVPNVTDARIAGVYTGSDTCEGPFMDATLSMTRQ